MNTENTNDQLLLNNFVNGDERSFEMLVKKYRSRIYQTVMYIVRDAEVAKDIVQDVFLKAINEIRKGRYVDQSCFGAWIGRIAHNMAIDHIRRSDKMQMVRNDDEEYDIFDTMRVLDKNREDDIISEQIKQDLKKLVNSLPESQREIIFLRHYAGLKFHEIAEEIDVNLNTALGRMRYALKNLRKMIDDNGVLLAS
jgi:RNA polymerase sigma factor (sigma-70 family)